MQVIFFTSQQFGNSNILAEPNFSRIFGYFVTQCQGRNRIIPHYLRRSTNRLSTQAIYVNFQAKSFVLNVIVEQVIPESGYS